MNDAIRELVRVRKWLRAAVKDSEAEWRRCEQTGDEILRSHNYWVMTALTRMVSRVDDRIVRLRKSGAV